MTTLIVYLVIAYAISVTIALACALESIGFWKIEATDAVEQLLVARAEIDDDNVIIAWQAKAIGGHIKESVFASCELNWWRNGGSAKTELMPAEVADAVEAWLAGEEVAQ